MMAFGGRRSCTRSIQVPDRSVSASRLASVANHSVSKRPIWLLEVAARSNPLTAKDRSHRRIVREPLGVIDIFVAGEPPKHRLAEQTAQLVACVLATAAVEELRDRHGGEPEGIIKLAVCEQTAVRWIMLAFNARSTPATA
jgi:hypothetical protein